MTAPAASNPFVDFMRRYRTNPVLFVREVLKAEPDVWQAEVMMAVARGERRISIRSGHGVGKTTCLAWLIIWWILTRFPQKTVCTAPTADQLFDALAAEVKAWITKLPAPVQALLEVQSEKIFLKAAPDESFISFRTSRPEKPEALAGVHSENVLLIGDEASGIPDPVFESAVGSMSGENATTVLAGNPVRSAGLFYETHTVLRDIWRTFHVSCLTCSRVTPDFVEELKQRYGELSNAFRVRVLGEFPLHDDDTIIPFELAEAALTRDVLPINVKEIWGVDVARFGDDKTAFARRKGNVLVGTIEERAGYDTMRTAGWIKSMWDATAWVDRPSEILVDVIGIGAGVVDRLYELKLPVRGINVAESPTIFDERYLNLRTELWFKGRDWLAKKDCNLAGDDALVKELISMKYKINSNGKYQAESKAELKKRLPKIGSPNRADAFLLTLAGDAVTAITGQGNVKREPLRRKIKGLV